MQPQPEAMPAILPADSAEPVIGTMRSAGEQARDLYDDLLQSLVTVRRTIGDILLASDTDVLPTSLERWRAVHTLAARALAESHDAIARLRAASGGMESLSATLAREVERVADRADLSSRFVATGTERLLDPDVAASVLCLARLALADIAGQADARHVQVTMAYRPTALDLTIAGDGHPAADVPSPADLQEMSREARLLGGTLTREQSTIGGTCWRLSLPYGYVVSSAVSATQLPAAASLHLPELAARVLIVDAQALSRAGMRAILARFPDIAVVGEAADALQALSEVRDLGANIVLMDVGILSAGGLEAVRQLKATDPDVSILLLSGTERDEDVFAGIAAGAGGYLLKDIAPDELAAAIRAATRGEALLHPAIAGKVVRQLNRLARGEGVRETLTPRETEVLRLLARGLRNKEIARELHLTGRTVNFHLANLYQKLEVTNRTEALSQALARGILKL